MPQDMQGTEPPPVGHRMSDRAVYKVERPASWPEKQMSAAAQMVPAPEQLHTHPHTSGEVRGRHGRDTRFRVLWSSGGSLNRVHEVKISHLPISHFFTCSSAGMTASGGYSRIRGHHQASYRRPRD